LVYSIKAEKSYSSSAIRVANYWFSR